MQLSQKRKNVLLLLLAAIIYGLASKGGMYFSGEPIEYVPPSTTVRKAFVEQTSDVQIQGQGKVKKVLPDDTKGSRHQKFIVQTDPEMTVLVAHNIDLAPRLPGLKEGDIVSFHGEYEWTDKGGVIHWTHKDPKGRHPDGWLRYKGQLYQ